VLQTPATAAEARALLERAWQNAGRPRAVAVAAAPQLGPRGFVRRWPNRLAYEGNPLLSDAMTDTDLALFDDATAAAISAHPAGDRHSTTICITIGTGVGGGAVIAGVPLLGRSGAAMDLGHMAVPAAAGLKCSCGRTGCLQAAASGRAMTNSLEPKSAGASRQIDAAVLTRAVDALVEALAILDRLFNPHRISIGGGLGLSPLFERIETALLGRSMSIPLSRHPYGEDAGLIGAGAGLLRRRDSSGSSIHRGYSDES
jgi:predicted NBD/HSP70 family sugar kinase